MMSIEEESSREMQPALEDTINMQRMPSAVSECLPSSDTKKVHRTTKVHFTQRWIRFYSAKEFGRPIESSKLFR